MQAIQADAYICTSSFWSLSSPFLACTLSTRSVSSSLILLFFLCCFYAPSIPNSLVQSSWAFKSACDTEDLEVFITLTKSSSVTSGVISLSVGMSIRLMALAPGAERRTVTWGREKKPVWVSESEKEEKSKTKRSERENERDTMQNDRRQKTSEKKRRRTAWYNSGLCTHDHKQRFIITNNLNKRMPNKYRKRNIIKGAGRGVECCKIRRDTEDRDNRMDKHCVTWSHNMPIKCRSQVQIPSRICVYIHMHTWWGQNGRSFVNKPWWKGKAQTELSELEDTAR